MGAQPPPPDHEGGGDQDLPPPYINLDAVTDAGVTAFTFLLYLTGDEKENPVVGGETAFFGSCSDGARALFEVKPERGAALIFRHGPECMPHASLPVRGGVKTVLRSDVVCRKG